MKLKKNFSVLVISDLHLDNNTNINFYNEMISSIKKEFKIDILIFLGDYIDINPCNNSKFNNINTGVKCFKMVLTTLKKELEINSENIIFIPGNHDCTLKNLNNINETDVESKTESELKSYLFNFENKFPIFNKISGNFNFDLDKKGKSKLLGIKKFEEFGVVFAGLNMIWEKNGDSKNVNVINPSKIFNIYKKLIKKEENENTIISLFHYPPSKWDWNDLSKNKISVRKEKIKEIAQLNDYIFTGDTHISASGYSVLDYDTTDANSQNSSCVHFNFPAALQADGNIPVFSVLKCSDNHQKVEKIDYKYQDSDVVKNIQNDIFNTKYVKDIMAFGTKNIEAFEQIFCKEEYNTKFDFSLSPCFFVNKYIFFNSGVEINITKNKNGNGFFSFTIKSENNLCCFVLKENKGLNEIYKLITNEIQNIIIYNFNENIIFNNKSIKNKNVIIVNKF